MIPMLRERGRKTINDGHCVSTWIFTFDNRYTYGAPNTMTKKPHYFGNRQPSHHTKCTSSKPMKEAGAELRWSVHLRPTSYQACHGEGRQQTPKKKEACDQQVAEALPNKKGKYLPLCLGLLSIKVGPVKTSLNLIPAFASARGEMCGRSALAGSFPTSSEHHPHFVHTWMSERVSVMCQ